MSDWSAKPSESVWYCIIIFELNGETDYHYGYCSDIAEYPSPTLLLPKNAVLLSVRVTNTHTGDEWERWNQEESKTPYGE